MKCTLLHYKFTTSVYPVYSTSLLAAKQYTMLLYVLVCIITQLKKMGV